MLLPEATLRTHQTKDVDTYIEEESERTITVNRRQEIETTRANMSQAEAAVMSTELPPAAQWTTNMTASSLTTVEVGNSCLDEQIERLKRCEYLREGEVKALCLRAREILVDESNVQRVDAPVTVRASIFLRGMGRSSRIVLAFDVHFLTKYNFLAFCRMRSITITMPLS